MRISSIMARKEVIPSLENALESGFSELKGGEENIIIEHSDESKQSNIKHEPAYGLKINAEESRETFISKPIKATKKIVEDSIEVKEQPGEIDETTVVTSKTEILDSPTSNIGDDFDVSW